MRYIYAFANGYLNIYAVYLLTVNIESHAGRITLLAEGCRGSLSEV